MFMSFDMMCTGLTVLSVRPSSRKSSGRYCIPAFSTRGKGALRLLLSTPAGASKRETPTSNLTESTGLMVNSVHVHVLGSRVIVLCFWARHLAKQQIIILRLDSNLLMRSRRSLSHFMLLK